MSRIVALVSRDPCEELAHYLQGVGFHVRTFRAPRAAPRAGTLVWLPEPERAVASIVGAVRRWLATTPSGRAILVSRRPAPLRTNLGDLHPRVHMLPAPIFGWQLVESLRDPRFALT